MKTILLVLLSTLTVSSAFADRIERATDIPNAMCGDAVICHMSISPTALTLLPFSVSGDITSGSTWDTKVVLQNAKEDAAYFVSTNGEVRTARLENALKLVRTLNPAAHAASDLAIAQEIIGLQ